MSNNNKLAQDDTQVVFFENEQSVILSAVGQQFNNCLHAVSEFQNQYKEKKLRLLSIIPCVVPAQHPLSVQLVPVMTVTAVFEKSDNFHGQALAAIGELQDKIEELRIKE